MKNGSKRKTLNFGEFILNVYAGCDKKKAREIVRYAVNEHLLRFLELPRVLIS